MNAAQLEFLKQVLDGLPQSDQKLIESELLKTFPVGDEIRAIESDLLSRNAYVFLWRDLLSLSAIAESARELASQHPDPSIHTLVALSRFLIKLRSVRVEIDEDEAKVLRAVRSAQGKLGRSLTMAELPESIQMEPAEAFAAAGRLRTKLYQEKLPLLAVDEEDRLSTPF